MVGPVEVSKTDQQDRPRRERAGRSLSPTAAIQGELGSFSHLAALTALGEETQVLQCRTFGEAFAAVERGDARYGVLPIENSLVGSIFENYDLLAEHALPIVGETEIRVSLSLLARPGARLDTIRRVHSHPVALNQCRRFFASRTDLEPLASYDTAGSVWDVMERGTMRDAAIGSPLAARLYGAVVLADHIEDDPENFTRFLVVAKTPVTPAGAHKTSLMVRLRHEPGALWRALEPLARHGLNLTKIESRPLRGRPWEYVFYLDVSGSEAIDAMNDLRAIAAEVRVLGCYEPAGRDERVTTIAHRSKG
jgi:prephenate dehydratase